MPNRPIHSHTSHTVHQPCLRSLRHIMRDWECSLWILPRWHRLQHDNLHFLHDHRGMHSMQRHCFGAMHNLRFPGGAAEWHVCQHLCTGSNFFRLNLRFGLQRVL